MKSWYDIQAKGEADAEVSIYDEIGAWGVTASAFVSALKGVAGRNITVRINSPGGSVTDGIAIFNALKRHDGTVTTHIDGLAASMASYVALAGKKVHMAENAYVMIHNPSGGAFGTAEDMRKAADVVDKMKATLVAGYAVKTGKETDEISAAMDAETWFTAEEAKDFGLVDVVTDSVQAVASFDLSKFRNAPRVDTRERDMTFTQEQYDAEVAAKSAAQAQAQKNFADFQAAKLAADTFEAELATALASAVTAIGERDALTSQLTAAKIGYDADKAGEDARTASAITSAFAGQGLPWPIKAAEKPAIQHLAPKNFSTLTGLDRAIAAHKAVHNRN